MQETAFITSPIAPALVNTGQGCLLRPSLCPPDPCSLTPQGSPGGVSLLPHLTLSWSGHLGIQRCVSAAYAQPCSAGPGEPEATQQWGGCWASPFPALGLSCLLKHLLSEEQV